MPSANTSTNTMRKAAANGSLLVFRGPSWEIRGYLCGMDDFHWKVVDIDGTVSLIHKSQASVSIYEAHTIEDLDTEDRETVQGIAGSFRQHCSHRDEKKVS
jgi:hypothetical protein